MKRAAILKRARELVQMRAIHPYPDWSFGLAGNLKGEKAKERKKIWEYFSGKKHFPSFPIRMDRNINLCLNLGDDLSWCLFVGGCIDPNELAYLKQFLTPGMVFVDVGANNGVYSLFSAKLVGDAGKVIAIEPSSRERKRLKTNIRLNTYNNIQVLPFALSDHKGKRNLHVATDIHNGQNTLGKFIYPGVDLLYNEIVELDTLDNILQKMNLRRLDFIKIDIEGSEYAALLGGKRTINHFKPVMLIEVSKQTLRNQGSTVGNVLNFLKKLRYSLYCFSNLTGKPKRIIKPTAILDMGLNFLAINDKSL